MKVLIACLATETNSFAPIPTGRLAFESSMVTREATKLPANLFTEPLHVWRELAEARGWEVVESLSAMAQPAGPTVREIYEEYRDEILADVEKHRPDILLLSMHGAMIADGYDDCEGDTLARARAILGPDAVIGLEIDPHDHLTPEMLANATVITPYKEYPHTDAPDRARELFAMVADTAEGKINPVMRIWDTKMITMYMTPKEPMRTFVDEMMAAEGKDGLLHLGLAHGFPWGDNPHVTSKVLAITDGDAEKAAAVAEEFGRKLWDMREELRMNFPTVSEALDRVQAANAFPMTLADFADNAGGGAPADSTYVLQEVLARGMQDVALALYWDPVLIEMCRDVGVGGQMKVRVGGKISAASGDPVDLDVVVRGIKEGMFQMMGTSKMPMGTGVWLEADGVHLILSEKRTQCFNPSVFTELGLDISTLKVMVAKSSNHFYAGFAPVSTEVIHMCGPGAITPDMTIIPFTKHDGNYWPKVENPFGN